MRTLPQLVRTALNTVRTLISRIAVRSTAAQPLCALAARLPTDTRRVFTLRKVYDLSPSEIAARLELTAAQVEHHLITAALACGRHFADDIDSSESAARGHSAARAPLEGERP